MKKLFSLLTLALLTMSAWAQTTVTINFAEQGYANAEDFDGRTVTFDGVSLTFSKGTGNTTPKYYTSGTNMRIYANNTMTVACAQNITSIVFEYAQGAWADGMANTGAIASGNWTGNATEIVFTNTASSQIRMKSMVVTLGEGGGETVDAPVFDPANNSTFIGSQTVSLTCATEGASILYRIGDAEYQDYTAPFTIDQTCTIYAKAVKGEIVSNEVHANYYRLAEVSTIAQAMALDSAQNFIFYGNPVVIYRNGGRTWIQDETGFGLIYGNQVPATVVEGVTLSEEWDAQFTRFHGMPQFAFPNNVTKSDAELVEIAATEYTEAQIDITKLHQRIMLKGVSLVAGEDAKYLYTADGLTIYNQFNIDYPTDLEGNTFDIEAMVGYFDGLQIMPINITLAGGQPIITCAAPTLPASTTFTESYEVVITNNEEGATVYYAINDGDFQEYTAPFTVEETTTVKAYATISGVNSEEVTATYTKLEPAVERTYALVKDASELADGDMIILVSSGVATAEEAVDYAMGAMANNNFGHAEVTIAEDLTITTDQANVITLEAQGENWAMKAAEGYLYAASSTKNQLKAEAEVDSNAIAAITIDAETGAAVIAFQGANTHNFLRYNPNTANNNPLFSCYAENSTIQDPVYIYKVKAEPQGMIGDVNNDGVVNITDVTLLISATMNESYGSINTDNADLNGDGVINITDVTLLIAAAMSAN